MKSSTLWIVVIIIALAVGGWFWYSQQGTQTPGPSGSAGINGSQNQGNLGQPDNGQVQQPGDSSSGSNATGDGTDVSQNLILGLSGDGSYLTAFNGMTLYTYSKDTAGVSNCSGQCAANWPPYTVPSADAVHVSSVFKTADVGTIARADGTLQVTYKGQPLYFYVKDAKPGDTLGDGVGGVWYLVKK